VAIYLCSPPEGCSFRRGRTVHTFCLTLLRMGFTQLP